MTELLKKDKPFQWEEKQQTAFERLKERLIKAPILQYPDFSSPSFYIQMLQRQV